MGKSDKGAMSGYLDDAIYLAKTSPGFKSINHYHVEKLPVRQKFLPLVKKDQSQAIIKTNLSPASYKPLEAFEYTKPKNNILIDQDALSTTGFISKVRKRSQKIPGPGAYNIQKAYNMTTMGAARGWK